MKVAIMQPYFFPYIGYFQLNKLLHNGFLNVNHIQALQRLASKSRFSALADSVCVVARP
jgi:hypothetical protein